MLLYFAFTTLSLTSSIRPGRSSVHFRKAAPPPHPVPEKRRVNMGGRRRGADVLLAVVISLISVPIAGTPERLGAGRLGNQSSFCGEL